MFDSDSALSHNRPFARPRDRWINSLLIRHSPYERAGQPVEIPVQIQCMGSLFTLGCGAEVELDEREQRLPARASPLFISRSWISQDRFPASFPEASGLLVKLTWGRLPSPANILWADWVVRNAFEQS